MSDPETPQAGDREGRIGPYVSLSEAISLIAFGEAMTAEQLCNAIAGDPISDDRTPEEKLRDFFGNVERSYFAEIGNGPFLDRDAGLAKLAGAWVKLREAVDEGLVVMRGAYSKTYFDADAALNDRDNLTGLRLAAFSQFDVSTGDLGGNQRGSHRCSGLVTPRHSTESFRPQPGRGVMEIRTRATVICALK